MYVDVPQIKLEEPQSIKTTFLEVYKEDTRSILSTYALYLIIQNIYNPSSFYLTEKVPFLSILHNK